MAQHLLVTFLILLCCHHNSCDTHDLTSHPGHLKPFGESGSVSPVATVQGYPDPNDFLEDFILDSKPLLMKGAAKLSSAFRLWTDVYLRKVAETWGDDEVLGAEVGKKEDRSGNAFMLSMEEAMDTYNSSDIYIAHYTPPYLLSDIHLPCPLQRPRIRGAIQSSNMWLSSGGTSSVLHTDEMDNINCVFRGKKVMILMERYKKHKMFQLRDDTSVDLDVDKVDLTKFPKLAGARFYKTEVDAGDCLFIPYMWPHQVRSFGSNVAVNVWWSHFEVVIVHDKDIGLWKGDDLTCDPHLTLESIEKLKNQAEEAVQSKDPTQLGATHGVSDLPHTLESTLSRNDEL